MSEQKSSAIEQLPRGVQSAIKATERLVKEKDFDGALNRPHTEYDSRTGNFIPTDKSERDFVLTNLHTAAESLLMDGQTQEVSIAYGMASGEHSRDNIMRHPLEQASHNLLGWSGNYHSLIESGRRRDEANTIRTQEMGEEADRAALDAAIDLLKSSGAQFVRIEGRGGKTDSIVAPVIDGERHPTGAYLRVSSGAFSEKDYEPRQYHLANIKLVIPGNKPVAEASKQQPEVAKPLHGEPIRAYMNRVLEDAARNDVPPHAVIDHFHGAALRSLGTERGRTALETLASTRSETFVDEDGRTRAWSQALTRAGGFRNSAVYLREKLSAEVFRSPAFAIENNDPDKVAFTNLDQLNGYLDVEVPEEETKLADSERAIAWRDAIIEEVKRYAEHVGTPGAWETANHLGSDIQGIRHSQEKWERSISIARKVGVDVDLIKRTAEMLRFYNTRGMKIGNAVLRASEDYSRLFRD